MVIKTSIPIPNGSMMSGSVCMCCGEWLMNGVMLCEMRIVFNAVDIVMEIWMVSWMVLMSVRVVKVRSMMRSSLNVMMSALQVIMVSFHMVWGGVVVIVVDEIMMDVMDHIVSYWV